MGESSEVDSEEEKVVPDKNQKRRLKTQSQVESLEKFYNEHKYPTESMKSQLAEKIGLTEKQISGWFCHRRIKDKKLLGAEACSDGRRDRSSGVIQDLGSGYGQDSCGSTKPGEYRHVDRREVNSQRLYGQYIPAVDLTYGKTSYYRGNLRGLHDASSESSSALRDGFISQGQDPYGVESSGRLTQNGGSTLINENAAQSRFSMRPSGYLKLTSNIEHAAITAVKRQLGRHYRLDGPPLGIEFDPLPPGAFETSTTEPSHEPSSFVSEPILPRSLDISGVRKQRFLSTTYDVYNSKISFEDSCMGLENIGTLHGSSSQDNYSHHQFKNASSCTKYSYPLSRQYSSLDISEDAAGKFSIYKTNRNLALRSENGVEEIRLDSDPCLHLYDEKNTNEQTEPYLHEDDDPRPKIVQKRGFLRSKPSKSVLRHSESLDVKAVGLSKRISKVYMQDESLYGERSASKKYDKPVQVKMNHTNEMTVNLLELSERVRDDYPQPVYVTKASFAESLTLTNQMKGSVMEMPSSFSEDETVETSSSMD